MSLDPLVGTVVTLTGTATDDAAGALVVLDTGAGVFVAGVRTWGDRAGSRVAVTGTLAHRRLGPEPRVLAGGLVTQGQTGPRFVLDL